MRKRRKQPNRRGAVMVEMAIVLPFFMLILLGIIEFGRAMMVSQLITTAARDGCRLAILGGSSNAEVEQTVKHFLKETLGVDSQDVTISVSATGDEAGSEVADAQKGDLCTVHVEVPYDKVGWIQGSYLAGKELKGVCIMRHL